MTSMEATAPVCVFAPARVDLSPGFPDISQLCEDHPGSVVNVALDIGVEVKVSTQVDRGDDESFADKLRTAIARRLGLPRLVVALDFPELPPGRGLGASGALSVALAYALSLHAGASTDPAELVELAYTAERAVGLTGGTQDQLASMYGGAGIVCRHRDIGRRTPIEMDLVWLGDRLLLVHGRGSRNSGSIIEKVLYERPRAEVLRIIAAMNGTAQTLARSLTTQDVSGLAESMNEATSLLRNLHTEIVENEVAEWLRRVGAAAAKPCGAGGRGTVWATLVDPRDRSAFADRVRAANWTVLSTAPSAFGARQMTG